MTGIPAAKSPGEELFALHCTVYGLAPQREVELVPGRKWRVDFFFAPRVVVEIEGGTSFGKSRHSRGDGFEMDARKYNALALAGYVVLRFSTAMVERAEAIDTVRDYLKGAAQ